MFTYSSDLLNTTSSSLIVSHVKETVTTILPALLFGFLLVCLLFSSLLVLYGIMFTLYGLLTCPWRMLKKTDIPSTNVTVKCDLCGAFKARTFYRLNTCRHLYCYHCFKLTSSKRCSCPMCSIVVHTFCKICHGDNP